MTSPRSHTRLSSGIRYLGFAAVLGAVSLAGCAQNSAGSGTAGVARSFNEAWQRVQAALAIGSAYDRGLIAARNNDTAAFDQARRDLQSLDAQIGARRLLAQAPLSPAEEQVALGTYWSTQSRSATTPEQKALAEQREEEAYRKALKMSPGGNFVSSNAEILNSLGYFLADKGRGREDFVRAEKLTRQALQVHDQEVQDAKQKSGAGTSELAKARFSRANTRDSLAWALFWQASTRARELQSALPLLKQAQREQEAALKEAREADPKSVSAELLYHLALILSAQNVVQPNQERYEKAMSLLAEALQREPGFEPAQKAAGLLS